MWPLSSRHYFAAKRLALAIGLNETDVLAVLSLGPHLFYDSWPQRKSDGNFRTIMAPTEPLRTIQERLLPILYRHPVSPIAHGFVPKRGLLTNAKPHLQSKAMYCLDIKDAFGSVFFSNYFEWQRRINRQWAVEKLRVDNSIAEIICQLVDTVHNNNRLLAQGAPTSPHIFNIICSHVVDQRLIELAEKVGGTVTRYADNIAFSVPRNEIEPPLRRAIWRIIEDNFYFEVNRQKVQYFSYANTEARPLRLPGINIINGEIRLRPAIIRHYRIALFLAGKQRDRQTYNGIKGHIMQVLGEWPSQLDGMYEKGLNLHSV